jgi:hypothetical protein
MILPWIEILRLLLQMFDHALRGVPDNDVSQIVADGIAFPAAHKQLQ